MGTSIDGAVAAASHGGGGGGPEGSGGGKGGGGGGPGGGGLLEIVVSQRDRFRQRATQLEEEKGQAAEELARARKQLEDCRADNVALYEKVSAPGCKGCI